MDRYARYIASPEWAAKRERIIRRARSVCEICRHRKATQVHHLTYKNLGDEPLEDLRAVCLSCHASQHPDKLDGRFVPLVEMDCEMCPSGRMEVFWEGRTCRTFCPGCGHDKTVTHPASRRRKEQRPATSGVVRGPVDANANKYRERVRELMKSRER